MADEMNRRQAPKRKRVKIVYITVVGEDGIAREVEAKECTKCGEVKTLTEYYASKSGTGGRTPTCIVCTKDNVSLWKKENPEKVAEGNRRWRNDNKEIYNSGISRWRKSNKDRANEFSSNYYRNNKASTSVRKHVWYLNNRNSSLAISCAWRLSNPQLARLNVENRRTRKYQLPYTADSKRMSHEACILSGDKQPHIDHFIPLSLGHAGTYRANIISLSGQLNMHKKASNPFDWIRTRDDIPYERFHSVVCDLAAQNGLTPDEYRRFVDWCYANPRTVDEVRADNERYGYKKPSLEIWREATGLQFPIRVDFGDLSLTKPDANRRKTTARKRKEISANENNCV